MIIKNTLFLFMTACCVSFSQTTRVYWTTYQNPFGRIESADISGSDRDTVLTGVNLPDGIAIDNISNPKKLYVNERGASRIFRVNLDGSELEEIVTGIAGIIDIELDLANRKIYWTKNTYSDDRVSRADMDNLNSQIEDLYLSTSTAYDFFGITIDTVNQNIFWVQAYNGGSDKIQKRGYYTAGVTTIVTNSDITLLNPWDIDLVGNKIYWSDPGLSEDRITSANTDGSFIDTVATDVGGTFFAVDENTGKIYWGDLNCIKSCEGDGSGHTDVVTGVASSLGGIALAYNVTPVSVKRETGNPANFTLHQNYPNPFNPTTVIEFSVGTYGNTSLRVYDLLGREVAVLVNEKKPAGSYQIPWNATGLAGGVYFYRLVAGENVQVKKLVLLK